MGILGKLFGGESKSETLVRAYGKLPFYAEYRRLEISPGAPTVFSQWLDAGRLAWAKSPSKSAEGSVRSLRAVVRVPGGKELVVASLWDSRDSLGRTFPFCFFVIVSADALGADPIEQLISAWGIQAKFDEFYGEIRSLSGGGDFYRMFRQRVVPTRPADLAERVRAVMEAARAIPAAAWLSRWVHNVPGDRSGWFAGAAAKTEWFRSHPQSMGDAAMSFPLAAGFPVAAQAAMWLDWASPSLSKLGKAATIIAPAQESGSSSVHLIIRDVVPDDFQLLTNDDGAYGYVERINVGSTPFTVPPGSLMDWLRGAGAGAGTPAAAV